MNQGNYPENHGFKNQLSGVHTSRTMMFDELQSLLGELSPDATPEDYEKAIVEENALFKKTHKTRETSVQKLRSLYGLDPEIKLFYYFRKLWDRMESGYELLACLLANARDPILRLTIDPVLELEIGQEFHKQALLDALKDGAGDAFTINTLKSTSRNTASTWTQSGHLKGHSTKYRARPEVNSEVLTYALLMGYLTGRTGERLFDTTWVEILDINRHDAESLANQASKEGYLTFKKAGDVVSVDFSAIMDEEESLQIHEQ